MLINHNIDINNIDNNENFIFQVLLNKGFTDTIGPQLWAMNRSMNKIIIDGITAKGPPVKATVLRPTHILKIPGIVSLKTIQGVIFLRYPEYQFGFYWILRIRLVI